MKSKKITNLANTKICENCRYGVSKTKKCLKCKMKFGICCLEKMQYIDSDEHRFIVETLNLCNPCFVRMNSFVK